MIAVAFAWVLLLDAGPGGTFNAMLQQLGIADGAVNFLGKRAVEVNIFGLSFAFPVALTVIIFESWRYFPLAFLFILARMQSISSDIYEAAEIDGPLLSSNSGICLFPSFLAFCRFYSCFALSGPSINLTTFSCLQAGRQAHEH